MQHKWWFVSLHERTLQLNELNEWKFNAYENSLNSKCGMTYTLNLLKSFDQEIKFYYLTHVWNYFQENLEAFAVDFLLLNKYPNGTFEIISKDWATFKVNGQWLKIYTKPFTKSANEIHLYLDSK